MASPTGPSISGYEIIRELGRGGMGVVYLAWQSGLHRLVALKMILAGEYSRPVDRERFLSEAEVVARLEHPNLVKIHETGEQDGRPYFSMEYVKGGRLTDSLRGTPLSPLRTAQLAETLARATHAAHERGVIHRDLTPSNVLLTPEGEPKIVDFGLAKLTIGGMERTKSGDILGTPSYMAPEQASGQSKGVGPAADVYALGAILYEMLTGRPPFKGETLMDTLSQVIDDEPVTPCRLQSKVPRDLETVCLKCLNKEPSRRYASALELALDLQRYLTGEPVHARPIGLAGRAARWARRKPAIASLLSLCIAGAIVAFVAVTWEGRKARLAQTVAEQAQKAEETQRIAAESAREQEARQRRLFQGLSAVLLRDRALRHCEDGDIGRGLLWLAECLQRVPDDDPTLQRAIRTNLAGWQWQAHPLLALLGHSDKVFAAAWSPDGRLVLTGGADKAAHFWNAETGDDSRLFVRFPRAITTAAFSPDGAMVLTVAGQEAYLRKTASGEPAFPGSLHLGEDAELLSHSFSPDGRSLWTAVRRGRTTWLQSWQTETGKQIGHEVELGREIALVTFSPNGGSFVTCSDRQEARACLWRTRGGKPVRILNEHGGRVSAIAFDPRDGRSFVTGSYDQTCRVWDTLTGELKPPVLRQSGAIRAVAFSPNGRAVFVGGHDRIAQLWDLAKGNPIGGPMRHPDAVKTVRFSADGQLALTVSWDQVRLWDAETGEQIGAPLPHQRDVVDASFSPDCRSVLTRSKDRTVRIWGTAAARPAERRLRHKGWVTAVALHPTTRDSFLTGIGGSEGKVLSWRVNSGQDAETVLENLGPILSLAYRPDGQLFAAGTRQRKVWFGSVGPDGREHPVSLSLDDRVWSIAFSPDGHTLLTGIEKGRAEFWEVATGKKKAEPLRHEKAVYAVAYSPDGRTVLTGSEDATARLWDAVTHQPLRVALTHQGTVYAVAFHPPDGQLILTGSDDRTARLWRTATGQPIGKPLQHPARVLAVAFSPDGSLIATGCGDGLTRLWDTATGHPIGRPLFHRGPVRSVAFAPRPQSSGAPEERLILVSASEDMTARVWEVPPPLDERPEQIMLSAQVASGMALDPQTVADSLTPATWRQLRRKLNGESEPPIRDVAQP